MSEAKFATCINCIDGRVQLPVYNWLKEFFKVDYVDMLTAPGVDKVLCCGAPEVVEDIRQKVLVSVNAHKSTAIAVVGHYDCTANPGTREEHQEQIRQAIQIVLGWSLPSIQVIALWVNEQWQVECIDSSLCSE